MRISRPLVLVAKILSLNTLILLVCSPHLGAQESFRDQIKVYERDDIHSIHKKLYTKEGRHEATLGVGGIFNNDGYALLLGSYTYHLFENLGIEAAVGGLGFQFGDSNKLSFFQSGVTFSPLYGKLSLFTWSVVNFDIYVAGGAGAVSYSGLNTGSGFMGNYGIGERFFINEFLSFKIEFRDYIYNQKLRAGGSSRVLHNYSLIGGISVLMPFSQKY